MQLLTLMPEPDSVALVSFASQAQAAAQKLSDKAQTLDCACLRSGAGLHRLPLIKETSQAFSLPVSVADFVAKGPRWALSHERMARFLSFVHVAVYSAATFLPAFLPK